MNVLEDMAMQIGTDAYMREDEAQKTCDDCYSSVPFDASDGMTMMLACPKLWVETVGAIKAINGVVKGCGFCQAHREIVLLDDEACEEWEEA